MRSIREILRLKFGQKLSNRAIAKSCAVSHTVINHYVLRAVEAGLTWPLSDSLDDAALEQLLHPAKGEPISQEGDKEMPSMQYLYQELKRKNVTLQLLWYEYRQTHPQGHAYSWFCEQYRRWRKTLDVTMRQEHRAGEKLFVDWAGQTMPIQDGRTGEVRQAQIFIACLGASSYTYAEARLSQSLEDWTAAHVNAFAFFFGVPEIVVPDNLKAGVTKACRYEPELNPTYLELARYYGVAIIPARVKRPKDKAKVESAVGFAERFILAALRNRTFFNLAELNAAITEKLTELNNRKFQKLDASRRELFEQLDKPALQRLPAQPWEYAWWKRATVNIDYHIELERHYYSVPYQLVGKSVDVRVTAATVEVLHKNKRVASHRCSTHKGGFTTVAEHMPERHKKYLEWTPARIIKWAGETGPNTQKLVAAILSSRPHPQQGYRSCLGILRLANLYGAQRLEAASARALAIGACSYKSIESILKTGLDRQQLSTQSRTAQLPTAHENLRGKNYYDEPQNQQQEASHA